MRATTLLLILALTVAIGIAPKTNFVSNKASEKLDLPNGAEPMNDKAADRLGLRRGSMVVTPMGAARKGDGGIVQPGGPTLKNLEKFPSKRRLFEIIGMIRRLQGYSFGPVSMK